MILTCPDCATRYFVADDKLGPQGRTVRCAGCGSSWRAQAETPLELTVDAESGATASEPKSFAAAAAETPSLGDAPAAELPKILRAKAEEKKRRGKVAVAGAVWGVLGLMFTGLFASAYAFRQGVVELLPHAAGAYAAVGVPVNPLGLEFSGLKAAPTLHDGAPAIAVSGVIRNVGERTRTTPPLAVALVDDKGRKLTASVVAAVHGSIRPGGEARVTAVLTDPGAKAADVDVRFALPGEAAATKPHARPVQHAATASTPPALRPALSADPAAVDAVPHHDDSHALDAHDAGAVSAAPHG